MAQIKDSPLEGLRGTLGDLVFRTWGGKTFVYPKASKPARQTAAQKANHARFRQASMQAKEMLEDDSLRRHYEIDAMRQKLPNAYTAALRSVLTRGTIENHL